MNNQEIRSEDWAAFCEKFTETNRGSLLSVESMGSDGVKNEIARDCPLDEMIFEKTDACSDFIHLNLGGTGERRINHQIIEPIRILLVKSKEGRKILQIEAESGTTLVSFHTGMISAEEPFGKTEPVTIP